MKNNHSHNGKPLSRLFCGIKRLKATWGLNGKWGVLLFAAVLLIILLPLFFVFRDNGNKNETARLGIVMYHDVKAGFKGKCDYKISTSALEEDFRAYKESEWTYVTLQEVFDYAKGKGDLPEKSLLLVFDDGYISLKTEVMPLLKAYDANAIVSVIGARAGGVTYSSKECSEYLSWDELVKISKSGLFELQYHSMYLHVYGERKGVEKLPCESKKEYEELILNDVKALRETAQRYYLKLMPSFAYPYGIVEPLADKILAHNGFRCTMTSEEHTNLLTKGDPCCLFRLGRMNRSGYMTTKDVMTFLEENRHNVSPEQIDTGGE